MAQFDVYRNTNKQSSRTIPYFVNIQHELLSQLPTRVVIPLFANTTSIKKLNPTFSIQNQNVILASDEITSLPRHLLEEKVDNLSQYRDEIIASIDFLITGF
jgi:toxin CcdB